MELALELTPRYGWVNQAVFIARGRLIGGGVMYEVNGAT
jgi:hypothetical protein